MVSPLRFHPLLVDDLKSATDWYDRLSTLLGDRFRASIDQSFDSVASYAESFAIVFDEVRAARVKRFPYLLLFEIHPSAVHVIGLFHTASDPRKWKARL